jgi:hypothetical protein
MVMLLKGIKSPLTRALESWSAVSSLASNGMLVCCENEVIDMLLQYKILVTG